MSVSVWNIQQTLFHVDCRWNHKNIGIVCMLCSSSSVKLNCAKFDEKTIYFACCWQIKAQKLWDRVIMQSSEKGYHADPTVHFRINTFFYHTLVVIFDIICSVLWCSIHLVNAQQAAKNKLFKLPVYLLSEKNIPLLQCKNILLGLLGPMSPPKAYKQN